MPTTAKRGPALAQKVRGQTVYRCGATARKTFPDGVVHRFACALLWNHRGGHDYKYVGKGAK